MKKKKPITLLLARDRDAREKGRTPKTLLCGFPARKKVTPRSSGEKEDTHREAKKGYRRRRLAIGPRKDSREPVNVADDTLLFGYRKWFPHDAVLSLFLSSSFLPLPSPSHFDADKSSLLKKHRASCCELIYERPIH